MKIIIPTYNRSAKLNRTLRCYKSSKDFNINDFIVIDGSNAEHSDKNKESCMRYGFEYKKYDPKYDLVQRLLVYLKTNNDDNLVFLGSDEDVFLPGFVKKSKDFMDNNKDYSTFIGRYITFCPSFLFLNRISHFRDYIVNANINNDDACQRVIKLLTLILVGCSPVFFSIRRKEQLIESLENQLLVNLESTEELIDQTTLALSGKIMFDSEPMLLRDETNYGYKYYDKRHDIHSYITLEDINNYKKILKQKYHSYKLGPMLRYVHDLWTPTSDDDNSLSISLSRHRNAYTAYKPIHEKTSHKSSVFIKIFSKIGIVISQTVSWFFIRKELESMGYKNMLKIFLEKIPTHEKLK